MRHSRIAHFLQNQKITNFILQIPNRWILLDPHQNKFVLEVKRTVKNEERLVISMQSWVNQAVDRRLLHVGLHGYSQSISFTSCLLPKYQSPTASAIVCYANNRWNSEDTCPTEDTENSSTEAIAVCCSNGLNLTLSSSHGETGECHEMLDGVWLWVKHESMNSPQFLLSSATFNLLTNFFLNPETQRIKNLHCQGKQDDQQWL